MPRVLVAETNAAIRSLLGFILESRGYDVDRVPDGAQAIDSMIAFEPDLVITNIEMPEIDGFSLMKAIRRMPPSKAKVPIVVLSTDASRENVIKSIQSGGNDFVSKNELHVQTLLAKVAMLLGEEAVAAAEESVAKEAAEAESASEPKKEKKAASVAAEAEPEEEEDSKGVYKLPDGDQIGETVSGLVGRDVNVTTCDEQDIHGPGPFLYGIYIQSEGERVAAISISELKLGAYAGAALSLIPVGAANDFIKKKELDEEMFENFEEVVNVSAALFNLPDIPHVKLRAAHAKLEDVPGDATPLLDMFKSRVDVSIDIADYGSGKMTIISI